MTFTIIICAILGVAIVAVLVTQLGWSIATQHRDHEVIATGRASRRWIWSRRRAGRPNDDSLSRESISGQTSNLYAGITEDQG